MSNRVRVPVYLSLLFALTLVLAACPAGGAPSTGAQPAAPQEAGVVELQLMGWSSSEAENKRLQEVIDGFNEATPDINVTLNLVPEYDTKLQTALAGGSPPDVFYLDSFRAPDLVKAGAIEAVGDEMTDVDDFYPSLRDAFTIDGVFYCPPKDFGTLALQYNKEMFDAAGVEHPTADWTWDDLRSAAEQLANPDAGVYGIVLPSDFARWIVFLYQAGGSVTNEDVTEMTLNSPEALEAMEFYVGLVRDGFAAQPSDLDSGWPGEAFGKGRAAMAIEGNWMIPFLADQFPDLSYGITELPAGPAGKATMAFTVCYAVPANAPHRDASIQLVDYLTGAEGMKAWTDLGLAMPTRASLRDGWLEMYSDLEPFLNGADYAHKWQFRPGFNDVLDTINDGLQQAFAGSITAARVLEQADNVGAEVMSR